MRCMNIKSQSEWVKKINKDLNPSRVIPTNMIPMAFNQSETRQLMKACKSHNVSPFAAFQAALLTVLNDKVSLPEETEFHITVNLRSYYAKSKADYIFQHIVSYATSLPCKTTIPNRKNNSDFWTLAEYCKNVVHDSLVSLNEKSLQLGSLARNIPADVLISGSGQVTSVATFHNLGN